nr:hypothetical protein [uncultured Pseudomonas sp.]
MRTISIDEFQNLVARNDWKREQDHDVVEYLDRQVEEWDDEKETPILIKIPHAWGWASKTSSLDGIKIIYTESFSYDLFDPDSLSSGTDGQDNTWSVEGVTVVDEDGDEMNADKLADYLSSDFSNIDYSVLEIEQVNDIDVDEGDKMETFTIEIDGEPDIRFTGELVASAHTSNDRAAGTYYSGHPDRWTKLYLYKTKGGKFVCHQIDRTIYDNNRGRLSGKVCETPEEVKEFFGYRWLAKELYDEAGIDYSVEVE